MLKKLSAPKKVDICPNCGTACFATDVLCTHCGKNLDELFEQLPDLEESPTLFQIASKYLLFLNWLTPLLLILLPLIVSLVTALPFALTIHRELDRNPLQVIAYAVPYATLVSSGFLIISALLLFLCTTSRIRSKLGARLVITLAGLFSILSVLSLWTGLPIANIISAYRSFVSYGADVFFTAANWVHFVSLGGTVLVALNLITVIGQEQTA